MPLDPDRPKPAHPPDPSPTVPRAPLGGWALRELGSLVDITRTGPTAAPDDNNHGASKS